MGGPCHLAVVEALQFVQLRSLVAHDFHHAHQVGIFLVSPQHLEVAVARDEHQRRRILPDVKKRRELIDDRLGTGIPRSFLTEKCVIVCPL